MNLKKLASLPIILSIAAFIATALNECNIHKLLIKQKIIRKFICSNDSKTFTFCITLFVYLLLHCVTEILLFVFKTRKSKFYSNLKSVHRNLTHLTNISFIAILTGYIMKVNEDNLCKLTVSLIILIFINFISSIIKISVVSFIFTCSIYYTLYLIFAFSFIKHFSMIYHVFKAFLRSFYFIK